MTLSKPGRATGSLLLALVLHYAPVAADGGIRANQDHADEDLKELVPMVVQGQRVAIFAPANTYASLATALRYDPAVRLQTRGLPEGQADITVRGGLFENTGFRIGAVTVIDPQTGHYAVEIPFDPAMLAQPAVLTDTANAAQGFNASVATLQYRIRTASAGGSLTAGAGSHDLRFGVLRAGKTHQLTRGRSLGAGVSLAGSRGDGTVPFGDHDFKRYAAQVSLVDDDTETHFLAGHQDKFFGWPGAYTGFASLPETDRTRLLLLLADHRRTNARGWWELTAAWRNLEDDYDFDRRSVESATAGSFEHETRAAMLGFSAKQYRAGLDWLINAQFTDDHLLRSTDLTSGEFTARSYFFASVVPSLRWDLDGGRVIRLTAGLRVDWSDRDEDALSPLLGIEWEQASAEGVTRVGLEFARSTQLPGYTALNSSPVGLFGGNAGLERESAETVTLRWAREQDAVQVRAALFHRRDRDLVDWTFRQGAPFVRQANPVDIDVLGLEASLGWQFATLWVLGGYAWLDKDADYGSATVDASFYALNYARHRATLAVVWRPLPEFELQFDNEYRVHADNPLRSSTRRAHLAAVSALWRPRFAPSSAVVLAIDNLTDTGFQEFPGTPPSGRQGSVSLRYDW